MYYCYCITALNATATSTAINTSTVINTTTPLYPLLIVPQLLSYVWGFCLEYHIILEMPPPPPPPLAHATRQLANEL